MSAYTIHEVKNAQAQGRHGVVMLTSDRVWLAGSKVFIKNGFEEVSQAPPTFHLLVKRFGNASLPRLPDDWEQRAAAFGDGLTVIRTPQCPYINNGAAEILRLAGENGISAKEVALETAAEVQSRSPSAYGVFGVVLDGKLFSYHYLGRKEFAKRLNHAGST